MVTLDAATVLLQWATGGLAFLWVTTRRRKVGVGYGWLLRGVYGGLAATSAVLGIWVVGSVPVRDAASIGVALACAVALVVSARRRAVPVDAPGAFPPALDLVAPVIGMVGVVAGAVVASDVVWPGVSRFVVGALFLGAVSDAMLLGHWYLVQPGLPRAPLLELIRISTVLAIPEVALLLVPVGMISVLDGTIDDAYGGLLGWFWVACPLTTVGLLVVPRLALRERQYSAVMAATGLLYLAILVAFGTDLVARALLAL